ncbi:MAG: hypothetical protein KDC38_14020 [Planctomycetes bacterium]|nr:hypothetical protein [Planctomycetota bacterium]
MEHDDLYSRLATAFVRGEAARGAAVELSDRWRSAPLASLDGAECREVIARGRAAGLRVHRFKRTSLPRVRKVLGILRGIAPLPQRSRI